MTRTETTTLTKKAESYKKLQHYIEAQQEDQDHSRSDMQERLQYRAAGTVGMATAQSARNGIVIS